MLWHPQLINIVIHTFLEGRPSGASLASFDFQPLVQPGCLQLVSLWENYVVVHLGLPASILGSGFRKANRYRPQLPEVRPIPFPNSPGWLAFGAGGEILRRSPQGFGASPLQGSVPLKQFCANNVAYQSPVAQGPICLITDSNLPHRGKLSPSFKNSPLKNTRLSDFHPQPRLFKGAWTWLELSFINANTIITYAFQYILKW